MTAHSLHNTIDLVPDDATVLLPENKPFCFATNSAENRVGFLLVHGFTGSPWEMREIGQHLAQSGACSLGVRLPGHGTTADDLAERSYEEWLNSVEIGYRHLAEKYEFVVGIGLSTGALLLLAAARNLRFSGLVLLSPYLKMRQWLAPLAGILQYFVKYNHRLVDSEVSPYYYRDRPIASVHQINRLIRRVRRNLPEIKIPIMVASAAGDVTINSGSAINLYNHLGSQRKEYYRFGREVPHVLTTADNPQQEEIFRITAEFTRTLIPG